MKLIPIIVLLLVLPCHAQLVQAFPTNSCSGIAITSLSCTYSSNVTAGQSLVCGAANDNFGLMTITTNVGDSFTVLGSSDYSVNWKAALGYVLSAVGGSTTVTVTLSGGSAHITMGCAVFQRLGPVDITSIWLYLNPANQPSVTTTAAPDYIISFRTDDHSDATYSTSSPWSIATTQQNSASGSNGALGIEYNQELSAGTYTPPLTVGDPSGASAAITIAFQPAAVKNIRHGRSVF